MKKNIILIISTIAILIGLSNYNKPQAYVLNPAKWATATVNYYTNTTNSDGLVGADIITDLAAMATEWHDNGSTSITLTRAGASTLTTRVRDGLNVINFATGSDPDSPYTVAGTYCWWSGTVFSECDMTFYDGYALFFTGTMGCAGGPNPAYVQDIAAHEFGHFLGLLHTPVVAATMQSGVGPCETIKESIEEDDILGIRALYPQAGAPAPTPAGPTLTLRTYKVKGQQRTDLTWSGLTGLVDIVRDSIVILVATANDGFHTDNLNKKGGGSYVYAICPTGSGSGCTNNVTATF